jgi:peroxiredoxin family protein
VLAVVLESGAPERLYTALSMLVSAAAEGEPARGLASFGALPALLDDDLAGRARAAEGVPPHGRERFARSLAELRATAREVPDLRVWACAAAMETHGLAPDAIAGRLDGVMSMPRFLREIEGARLVVV